MPREPMVVLVSVAERLREKAQYANPDDSQRDVEDSRFGAFEQRLYNDIAEIIEKEIERV